MLIATYQFRLDLNHADARITPRSDASVQRLAADRW